MHRFWNQKDLKSPPINTCKVIMNRKDIHRVKNRILNIIATLKGQHMLHKEAAILSRLIYRMKYKFRQDKGFKNIEKVHHCLLQYLNMNFLNDLQIFLNTFDKEEEYENDYINLPTQQMLEFILVKLQALAALFCHIIDLSCIAGLYIRERIILGQAWTVSVIIFSLMSRILVVSKHLVNKIFQWYNFLWSYHSMFKPRGVAWLPENYIFPDSLENLLNTDWFNTESMENRSVTLDFQASYIFNLIEKTELIPDNFDQIDLNLLQLTVSTNEEDTSDINDNTLNNFKDVQYNKNVDINNVNSNSVKSTYFMDSEDVGEKCDKIENLFDVNTSKQLNKKCKKIKKDIKQKINVHSLNNVHNIQTLEHFMRKEDKYRKINNFKSVSNNLKECEWKMLQKVVIKYINKILLSKSIKKSTKLISNIKSIIGKTFNSKLIQN